MGLLLSIVVIYVGVIEFLTVYSHFRRSSERSTSSGDLSPLIRRYEKGLYKERQRIINILKRYESQDASAENLQSDYVQLAYSQPQIDLERNVDIEPSSITTITCNDAGNYHSIGENSELGKFNNNKSWSNSALIDKTKGKHRTRLKKYSKHVKFGKSLEELDSSRTSSITSELSNYVLDLKNENLDNVSDNNNYLTQEEAFKQLRHLNDYLGSGLTAEEAWDVCKKPVSSDEDENRPFYELKFLHTLDGVMSRSLSKDSLTSTTNAESSWNPNKIVVSSDESNEFNQTVSGTKKKRRLFRKKKLSSSSTEIKLSSRSECRKDLIENVHQNAARNEPANERNSAEKAFWLIFSGEYTKAMNKDWHGQHFCCWQCDESLTGQRYVLRDEHPYCVACYESVFANSCEKCSRIIGIDSKDLSYKDKHWHEACFLCATCSDSLVDKQFGSKGERIYCGRCYDEQFASRCDGCGQIFRAGTKKMEYKTRQWHEKCFCCNVCKVPIGTQSFIPREQEIYCAKCYEEKYATRCIKCNKVITSGGVTYKNEPWHRECFTCTHCNTSLAGARFTSRDDKPYCAECFGELFAKRCTACNKPITGIGGTKFISFEDRHWHNDCFFCASCRTSLVGRGFITDADDIICPDCAKKNLM